MFSHLTSNLAIVWRLARLLRPFRRRIAAIAFVSLVLALIALVPPHITRLYLDWLLPAKDKKLLGVLVIGTLAVNLFQSSVSYVRSIAVLRMSNEYVSSAALHVFGHVVSLPMSYFDVARVGDLTNRLGDVRSALAGLARMIESSTVSFLYVIVIPPVLFSMHTKLALLSLLSTPLTAVSAYVVGRITQPRLRKAVEQRSALSATYVDLLANVRTLKANFAEAFAWSAVRSRLMDTMDAELSAGRSSTTGSFVVSVIRLLGTALCTWYGWMLVIDGDLSVGQYMAFAAYVGLLTGPISELAGAFDSIQRIAVPASRAFEVLDATKEEVFSSENVWVSSGRVLDVKRLAFNSVGFSYATGPEILGGVTFTIERGLTYAVQGVSGAGKSSLLRLCCLLDTPTRGSVLVDGRALDASDQRAFRRSVKAVWQDSGLLRGTIHENLLLGMSDVSSSAFDEALYVSGLDKVVQGFPRGIETEIAERGGTVSAGQRQRIALARALLSRPQVLILDEATSNLDEVSELEVFRRLRESKDGRILLYATHRSSLTAFADFIIHVADGRVQSGVSARAARPPLSPSSIVCANGEHSN